MNSNSQNFPSQASSSEPNAVGPLSGPVLSPAEATLQLIAQLPAPTGLEDRVIAAIHSAPPSGRILHWPNTMSAHGAWMPWVRGAAAAAIVFVVAGGGWGIYTHVQPSQPGKVIAMPRGGAPGGFSGAGAIRTPDTLRGPTVVQPAAAKTNEAKATKKTSARVVHAPLHAAQAAEHGLVLKDSGNGAGSQPKVSAAQ
jgi:hypothetical protein